MPNPLFEIVTTTAGAVSIRNNLVNEIMHNPVGPWVEANSLYIEQSQLAQLLKIQDQGELVLFDVGLGAAANSLATIHCHRGLKDQSRPLNIVSFEKDLELLQFALNNSSHFSHFRGFETAIEEILKYGAWTQGKIQWQLRQGDFLEQIEVETTRPHVIFFDPYSPKMNQEMWSTSCFQKLHRISRPPAEGGTRLYTYSQSTRIRAALLSAGFYVGYGTGTGLKEETTVAATNPLDLKHPLGQSWLQRFQKSHCRYPYLCNDEAQVDAQVEKAIQAQLKYVIDSEWKKKPALPAEN